jgi:CheY-like chemotaxis protein
VGTGKILVVDDVPLMRSMLRKFIELARKAGGPHEPRTSSHEVIEAANGAEALAALAGGDIDLIFLDLVMPVMDGATFLNKVKADARLSPIPVVITTALSEEAGVAAALERGAAAAIRKPFTLREVKAVLSLLGGAG